MSQCDKDRIGLAFEIATRLWDAGMRGSDGATVLAMALGIYLEAQEGAHREFRPLFDAVFAEAQKIFDLFRQQKPGHG